MTSVCSEMEQRGLRMVGDTILPCGPLTMSYIHGSSLDTLIYTTIGQLLDEACAECPDHEAFVICDTEERLTFKDCKTKAQEYAKGFLAIGLKKGDAICLAGMTSSDWLFLYFAAAYIGLVIIVAPTIPQYDSIFGSLAAKAKARLVVVGPRDDDKICHAVCDVMRDEPTSKRFGHEIEFIYGESGDFAVSPVAKERNIKSLSELATEGKVVTDDELQKVFNTVSPEDPYVLLPTSGSTGLPKLVAWKQGSLCNFGKFNFRSKVPGKDATAENPGIIVTFGIWVDDMVTVSFVAIGIYHKRRARVVFLPGDVRKEECDVEEGLIKVLHRERATSCIMWPSYYIDMLTCPNIDKYDLSSLRTGLLGSQKCSPELFDKLFKLVPDIIHTYGGTEPNLVTCTTSDYADRATRVETVGHPIPFYQVKIVDENYQVVPVDTPGEICTKGWSMFHSYWGEPELTKKAFHEGWYLTGDIGTMDSDGKTRIIGRKADAIRFKRYGDFVYPLPIEKTLAEHPKIKMAQVVGIPSDYIGDKLVACILLEDNAQLTEAELTKYCENNLPLELWVPDKFIFMKEYPRVGVRNKISKQKLREIVEKILDSIHSVQENQQQQPA